MAEPKNVSPEQAQALLGEGYRYLDVRSEREFEAGHPPGAYNVPINQPAPGGVAPNPDFIAIVERVFGKDAKIVVGCKTGLRSQRAVADLEKAGFTGVVEMHAGWDAARDAFGQLLPGWTRLGLPSELGTPPGRSYPDLKRGG